MLGVEEIASINSILVFSLMHLFLTETDLDSVVAEIIIQHIIPVAVICCPGFPGCAESWSCCGTSQLVCDELCGQGSAG